MQAAILSGEISGV